MRKVGTVDIKDRREFTVKELTLRQVKDLFESKESAMDRVDQFLTMCSDATMDDLLDLAPSEIDQLYEKFKEVNASFFTWARLLGLGEMLEEMKQQLPGILSGGLASLSDQGMERGSGNTDGASS